MSADRTMLPFQNPDLPVEERVKDLLGRLTLEEKAPQLLHGSPAIERLGIPQYNWWNEGMHGVARSGVSTVFPQSIGLAASFSTDLMRRVAETVSTEARAKHHEAARHGERDMYKGLTYWSPNINIFRDPRWGRGQETYGECPYLTGEIGFAFVRGMQGDDPVYFKTIATPKHFAVHSGPEALRHEFNAVATEKDLRETYLPAFRRLIVDGGAWSVMSAYNRTNGEACSASEKLLVQILREEWNFPGFVVSDCWAIMDFHLYHGVTKTKEESAALAIKRGCDLNCGCAYEGLVDAVRQGLVSEEEIDICLGRLIEAKIRLGLFDPEDRVPYAAIPYEVVESPEHRAISREAARQSIVLLKNEGGLLPLARDARTVAVIGPNAYAPEVLLANYHGTPSKIVTPLDGIRDRVEAMGGRVLYAPGCMLAEKEYNNALGSPDRLISEAVSAAERADVAVLFMGLSALLEGEQGDASNADASGDRLHINLPGAQQKLIERVAAVGKPVILVLICGSAVSIEWAQENLPAILHLWYPGPEGGHAIADVLFGDYSPAGRLPVTFYRSLDQLPPFDDYRMENRTYRFFHGDPLYPFGYGLSYGRFAYRDLHVPQSIATGENLHARVTVENTGAVASDEVVQLYVQDIEASTRVPRHSLRGFRRVHLPAGESREVEFTLSPRDLALVDDAGRHVLEPGVFRVYAGGQQPDDRSAQLTGQRPIAREFCVVGDPLTLKP